MNLKCYVIAILVLCGQLHAATVEQLTAIQSLFDGTGLSLPGDFRISPSGTTAYLADSSESSVNLYQRSENGSLQFLTAYRNDGDGVDGLDQVKSLAISPDGRHLYAGGSYQDKLVIFSRTPTGTLQFASSFNVTGGVAGVNVSPDGENVYVHSGEGYCMFYSRDSDTGLLTLVDTLCRSGVLSRGVFSNPDGENIYVLGEFYLQAIRRATDGSFQETQFFDRNNTPTFRSGQYLTVTPDGSQVLVAAGEHLVVFERLGDGSLSHVGEVSYPGVDGYQNVAVSSDGTRVYAAGRSMNYGVAMFGRDATGGLIPGQFLVPAESFSYAGARTTMIGIDDHLYAPTNDSLFVFSTEPAGALTVQDVIVDGEQGIDGLGKIYDVVVGKGGEHVYTLGESLVHLSRVDELGRVRFESKHPSVTPTSLYEPHRGLQSSPDGRFLYHISQEGEFLRTYGIDSVTGALTLIQDSDLPSIVGHFAPASDVTVTEDGKHLYVALSMRNLSASWDSLIVFGRNLDSGLLTVVETVNLQDSLLWAASIKVSPDGQFLYVGANRSINVYLRDEVSGSLSFVGSIDNGTQAFSRTTSIAISDDGEFLYAGGWKPDAIGVFKRDLVDGTVSEIQSLESSDYLDTVVDIELSKDETFVYASCDGVLSVFSREAGTGELSHYDTKRDRVDGVDSLDRSRGLAVSENGQSIYVASWGRNSLQILSADLVWADSFE